eukprot:1143200-Pelagomonas_calceolata.AAC.3
MNNKSQGPAYWNGVAVWRSCSIASVQCVPSSRGLKFKVHALVSASCYGERYSLHPSVYSQCEAFNPTAPT